MSLLSDQLWCPASAQVTVLQARGLRIKGKGGTNDAYAVMQVGKEKYQTSVVEKSVAPVWKEEATFDLPQQQQRGGGGGGTERSTLHVHVLHRALVGPDKLLGQAVINLLQLSEDRTRNKTEWFKLLDKTGKADKDRGEVLVDIQFMRNNMTASMFDLSAAGKSRSRLGKFKDKVRGKKKESDTVSTIVPSFTQVLTDSEEEGNGDAEAAAGKDEKKKKLKMKSLFSPKSNLQKNMSQSMSVLPGKNSPLSGSQSSGLNVDPSEGKKKFKFKIHKRSGSSDNKDFSSGLQKHGATDQSNLCINGSHVYCEEPPARTSRIGSNFSLASSGHGSMEDVPDSSPPSVDSLRGVRQYSPWTEEEEEMAEVENIKEDVEEDEERMRQEDSERLAEEKRRQERRRVEEEEKRQREEEERIGIEEEKAQEERRRRQEEEQRLAEEKRRLEEEERRRNEEEKLRKEEEERIQREEEEERSRREQEERARREEERERLAEEKRRLAEEEERRVKEEEKRQREEEEQIRKAEERAKEERRRQEEERKLAEEKMRLEEEEERRMIEEEEVRRLEEQERKRMEEEERIRMEEKMAQEQRRREEEESAKRQEEERKLAEQKRRLEEEERMQREEEERISMEEERKRKEEEERIKIQEEEHKLAEQKRRLEEEERMQREEEGRISMEEERIKIQEKEHKLAEEKERLEEEKRRIEEEEVRKEEERRRREEEELVRRLEEEREEKRRLEEQERKRKEEEERIKKEDEEKEEYERMVEKKKKLEEEERKKIEAEEKIRKEEEERVKAEEDRRKEEERRQEEEREKLAEEKRIMEEQQRRIEEEKKRQREEEENIRKEEERRHQEEERKRIVEEERIRQEEQAKIRMEKEKRSREAEEDIIKMEGEEKARKLEKVIRNAEERKKRANKMKQEVAGMKSKVGNSAEVCSTNPFDEDFSNNPFDENPNSPDSTTVSTVHQRSQPAVSSAGSKTSSADEKDLISSQREKRAAPLPPGRNQTERQSQKEHDGSTRHLVQVNKQTKDDKTASVPPQRSVHMIAPLSRSPADAKNPQSLVQSKGKRPAPSAPAEPKKAVSSDGKIANKSSLEAKQEPIAYGLNPFEDDMDENEPTAQDATGSIHGPPAGSQAADGDAASEAKIKSSKKARAPLLPATTAATPSTSINQNTEGGRDTGVTKQDDDLTHPCDPEEAPVQESRPVLAVAQEAGGKKEVPPVASRRLQPVKPLNPLGQQPVSVAQGEIDNKSTGIHNEVQEKTKANDTELKGPYSQLTREELISLVLKQDSQLSERDKKICELEQYIDNLLVRVMEESPTILMSMNAMKKTV